MLCAVALGKARRVVTEVGRRVSVLGHNSPEKGRVFVSRFLGSVQVTRVHPALARQAMLFDHSKPLCIDGPWNAKVIVSGCDDLRSVDDAVRIPRGRKGLRRSARPAVATTEIFAIAGTADPNATVPNANARVVCNWCRRELVQVAVNIPRAVVILSRIGHKVAAPAPFAKLDAPGK